MDYRKTYLKIIKKAKNENRKKGNGVYYENHHILPKSLFPLWKNKKSNLVLLTAREHFFCHKLLVKIYPVKEMYCALMFFCNNKRQGYCVVKSSREYEIIKKDFIENFLKKRKTKEYTEKQRIEAKKRWEENKDKWLLIYKEKMLLIYKPKSKKKIIEDLVKLCRDKFNKKAIMDKKKEETRVRNEEKRIQRLKPIEENKVFRKVICLETLEIFNSITDVALKLNVKFFSVWRVLQNNSRYSSIHNYHFEYYDLNKKYKQIEYIKTQLPPNAKKIKCIETEEIFDSISQAQKKYNVRGISDVCNKIKNKKGYIRKTAAGFHWEFVID